MSRRRPKLRSELQRYLDGELERSELPLDLRREAESWDLFLEDLRGTAPETAPERLERRVVAALEEGSPPKPVGPSPWRRTLRWLTSPRPIRVAPAPLMAGAVALLAVAAIPWLGVTAASDPDGEEMIYVQLFLEAPGAQSVAIAGDFNAWAPTIDLEDPDGDGVWSGRVAVNPGIYEYMFVLDGARWVTDPHAEWYSEDGFGNQNAVLAILPTEL